MCVPGDALMVARKPCEVAKPGKADAVLASFAEVSPLVHQEQGCELYAAHVGAGTDGDVVIMKRCDTANTGDIVVALVDEEEATLKRLRRRGNSIALEAANPAYETRIFGPDRVRIQGKLVALSRRY